MLIPIKVIPATRKNYKVFGFTLLLLSFALFLVSFVSFFSVKNEFFHLQTLTFGLIGFAFLTIALFTFLLKGVNKIEGMPAALIVGGSFTIPGIFFLFLGSPFWLNIPGITKGGFFSILFGVTVVIWEIYKTSKQIKK